MPFESKAETLSNLADFRERLVRDNPFGLGEEDLAKLNEAAKKNRADSLRLTKGDLADPDIEALTKRVERAHKGESLDFSITDLTAELEQAQRALQLMLLEGLSSGKSANGRMSNKDAETANTQTPNQDGSADLTKILERLDKIDKKLKGATGAEDG